MLVAVDQGAAIHGQNTTGPPLQRANGLPPHAMRNQHPSEHHTIDPSAPTGMMVPSMKIHTEVDMMH